MHRSHGSEASRGWQRGLPLVDAIRRGLTRNESHCGLKNGSMLSDRTRRRIGG